jgi:hypothetical protein
MTVTWTYAKSYPDAPHQYVLRDKVPAAFFEYYAEKIREEGVRERFELRGRVATYRYWYGPDGFKYWRVGQILNRCKVVPQAGC